MSMGQTGHRGCPAKILNAYWLSFFPHLEGPFCAMGSVTMTLVDSGRAQPLCSLVPNPLAACLFNFVALSFDCR